MSSQTRNQEYAYQYRSVALAQAQTAGANPRFCGAGPDMYPSIPDSLLELKNVYAHLVMRFDSGVATGKRKLLYIGALDAFDFNYTTSQYTVDATKAAFVNLTADANRYIDCKIDLTKWKDTMLPDLTDPFYFGQPQLQMAARTTLDGTDSTITGDIILWKVDLIYTTKAIQ